MRKQIAHCISLLVLACVEGSLLTHYTGMPVYASLDPYLSYQGRLADQNGNLLTGNYYITFCLYSTSSPATACTPAASPAVGAVGTLNSALWGETEYFASTNSPDNHLINGVFNAKLGSANAFPANLFSANAALYLGVNIYNGTSWDGQMSPLQEIVSAGYALNAGQLNGYTASLTPGASQIPVLDASGNLTIPAGTKNLFSAAATSTTHYGLVNIGSGGFGGGAGNFAGSSSGTLLAMNAVSGYGGSLADFQLNGTSFFKVDAAGNTTTYAGNLTINNLTAPTTAPTLSGAGGGSLSSGATYYGEYTWYNSDGQTTASAEAGPFSIGVNTAIQFTIPAIPTGATGAKLYLTPANGASGSETYQNVTITSGAVGTVTAYVSGSPPPTNNTAGGDVNANRLIITSKTNGTSGIILNNSYPSASTSPQIVWELNGVASRYLRTDASNDLISLSSTGALVDSFDNSGSFSTPGNNNLFSGVANAGANYAVLNIGSGGFSGGAGKFAGSSSGTQLAINAPSGFSGTLADFQTNGVSQWKIDASGNMSVGGTTNTFSAAATSSANNGVLNLGSGGFGGGAGNFAGSSSGTLLAENAPSGFGGNIIDAQANGVSEFKLDSSGNILVNNNVTASDQLISSNNGLNFYSAQFNNGNIQVNALADPTTSPTLTVTNGGFSLAAGTWYGKYTWYNADGETKASPESAQITTTGGASKITFTIPAIPTGATGAHLYLTPVNGASGSEVYQNVNITSGTTGVVTAYNAGSGPPGVTCAGGGAYLTGINIFQSCGGYTVLDAGSNPYDIQSSNGNFLFYNTTSSPGGGRLAINPGYPSGINTLFSTNGAQSLGQNLTITGNCCNTSIPTLTLDAISTVFTGNNNIFSAAANAGANYGVLNLGSGGFSGGGGNFAGSANGTLLAMNAPSGFSGNLIDLQVNGSSKFRVDANGHVIVGGSAPSVSAGSGDGTTPPAPSVTGSDTAGEILFGAGTGGTTASGSIVSLTFANAYTTTPKAVLLSWATAGVGGGPLFVKSFSTTGFTFSMSGTLPQAGAGSYAVFYWVVQ